MAHILLLGHLLSGCGHVRYLRMGVWRGSDGSSGGSSKLCRVGCTSQRPIALPTGSVLDFYESSSCCWALLRSGSHQVVRLPVKFSDGFTSALVAGSDPSWQARHIHLHSSSRASLTPSFVYIGPSVEASPSQSKPSVASSSLSAHVAIGGSPYLASSSFRYTLFKAPGYKIVLSPDGTRWQAMVYDHRLPSLRGCYVAGVVFGKGYILEDFLRKNAAYQSHHIHLLANKDRPMVYIGRAGLQGGGPFNWFGCNKCTWFGCFENVWRCICGYKCQDDSCFSHCTQHYPLHRCAGCNRVDRCPRYYNCLHCHHATRCSNCCGCYERQKLREAARQAREEAIRQARKEAIRQAAHEEAARQAREEAMRRAAHEEAARQAREEAMRRAAHEQAARQVREEAIRRAHEEAARQAPFIGSW